MRADLVAALIAGFLAPAPARADAELLSVFHWTRAEPYFGGISGIDVQPDGRTYVAVGDSGQVLSGEIQRSGDRITGATSRWIGGLRTSAGTRVDGDLSDSEGVALLPDGRFFVSFERQARVWKYADWEARAFPLPLAPGFRGLAHNGALEAVAVDTAGRVFTIPERALHKGGGHPLYVLDGQSWHVAGRIQGESGWAIVGADFDARDRLFILERRFDIPFGFASRVRLIDAITNRMTGEAVLETLPGQHDNLEGLAVWRDESGAIRLLMVSDDNNRSFQRTELVEYRITD